jgi:hypothetical protein
MNVPKDFEEIIQTPTDSYKCNDGAELWGYVWQCKVLVNVTVDIFNIVRAVHHIV